MEPDKRALVEVRVQPRVLRRRSGWQSVIVSLRPYGTRGEIGGCTLLLGYSRRVPTGRVWEIAVRTPGERCGFSWAILGASLRDGCSPAEMMFICPDARVAAGRGWFLSAESALGGEFQNRLSCGAPGLITAVSMQSRTPASTSSCLAKERASKPV